MALTTDKCNTVQSSLSFFGTTIVPVSHSILLHLLPLKHVHPHQVDSGEVALEESNAGLGNCHREADGGQDVEQVEGPGGEVGEVQHGVEKLVPCSNVQFDDFSNTTYSLTCTHAEEDLPVSVVELHPVVAGGVDKLVAGRTLRERHSVR